MTPSNFKEHLKEHAISMCKKAINGHRYCSFICATCITYRISDYLSINTQYLSILLDVTFYQPKRKGKRYEYNVVLVYSILLSAILNYSWLDERFVAFQGNMTLDKHSA